MADSTSTPKTQAGQQGRGRRVGAESVVFLGIVALVLVVANVAANYTYYRFDTTSNLRHSLSAGSRNLVSGLEDTMEVRAYFTADLPPPFNATEQYVRGLLQEYESSSSGQFQVRFIDPDTVEERDQAEQDGIREVQHQDFQNDSISVRNGYRGIAISYLGQTETIPVVEDTQGLEYALSTAIRQLTREPLPVGVVSGHGGPTLTKGLSTLRGALPSYELREVDVGTEIDSELRALLVVAPESPFNEREARYINKYVMEGGSLGVFGGSMALDLSQNVSATPAETGLEDLLAGWGITMNQDIAADVLCGRVPYRDPRLPIPIPVPYPPVPNVIFSEEAQEHPALFRIPQAPFWFTSSVSTSDRFRELDGRVLGLTSENAWTLTGDSVDLHVRPQSEWRRGQPGQHAVLVAVEGELPNAFAAAMSGETPSAAAAGIDAPEQAVRPVRVLVSGSSGFLRDEFNPPPQPGRPANLRGGISLGLNTVDWLSQDQDLIAIRAKNLEDPVLETPESILREQEEREEAARAEAEANGENPEEAIAQLREDLEESAEARDEAMEAYKFRYHTSLTVLPPLLVLLFGLLWWSYRRQQRQTLRAQFLKKA